MPHEALTLTQPQRDAFLGYFAQGDSRRKPDGTLRRVMGGAYARMMDRLGELDLWMRNRERREMPACLRFGPTALGIETWLAQDGRVTPELRAKAQARLADQAAAQAEWDSFLARERADLDERAARAAVAERERKLAGLRAIAQERQLQCVSALSDDQLLEFGEAIAAVR